MNLDDIDIFDPALYAAEIPHERFDRLRREAPVFWHKEPSGPGFWAITKHADVMAVSRDLGTFSSEVRGTQIPDLSREDFRVSPDNLAIMDPPRHTRFRTLLAKGFTPEALRRVEPFVRASMTRLIDDVVWRGQCDMVSDLAGNLPLLVIFEMLGVPATDRDQILRWMLPLLAPDDPEFASSPEEMASLTRRFLEYAHALAAERRGAPRDDILSLLMQAEVDGDRLSYSEFGTLFFLFLAAGSDTTRNLILNGMVALLEHPEQRARLLADPSLIPSAVEEMLRFCPSVIHFRRTATRDTEIRGQPIAAGDKVVLWYASANRDEEVFPNPHVFDIGRKPNNHIAFGYGPHFCIGNLLARIEASVAFEELLRRLPDLELDGPVVRLQSNWLNGVKRMPLRFSTPR
jgi:cholest-4-en-3-one 26-monooxygenase